MTRKDMPVPYIHGKRNGVTGRGLSVAPTGPAEVDQFSPPLTQRDCNIARDMIPSTM